MSTTHPFGTQIIGQTEKALNAILDRQLAGTGLTEPQWVSLTIAVMSGGSIEHAAYINRLAGVLKVDEAEAQARIDELAGAKLIEMPQTDRSPVTVTEAGAQLHARIRAAIAQITERLWGDLPADELATAGRVLSVVLERADADLARS